MKAWTLTAAAIAATLTLAGCAEDGPGSMIEAEPETFDTETVYEMVSVLGRPSQPGEQGVFMQFVSEESKRVWTELLASPSVMEGPVNELVPLSAERAAQVWDNKRVIFLMGVPFEEGIVRVYNYDPPTLRERYCPGCPERREEVRR